MTYYIPDAVREAAAARSVDGQLVDWHLQADHGLEPHDKDFAATAVIAANCIATGDCSLLIADRRGPVGPVGICQFNARPHVIDDECQNVTRLPAWIVLERRYDCEHAGYTYPGIPGVLVCRCLICGRCAKHTGNATQGHYWSYCTVRAGFSTAHFCCPGDCELDARHD